VYSDHKGLIMGCWYFMDLFSDVRSRI